MPVFHGIVPSLMTFSGSGGLKNSSQVSFPTVILAGCDILRQLLYEDSQQERDESNDDSNIPSIPNIEFRPSPGDREEKNSEILCSVSSNSQSGGC
jgi:hypothetical protein